VVNVPPAYKVPPTTNLIYITSLGIFCRMLEYGHAYVLYLFKHGGNH
jgi:hypothetical protein